MRPFILSGQTLANFKRYISTYYSWFPLTWHRPTSSWHGEDMGFCDLLHKNNIEIWCDTKLSLELGHLGTKKYQLSQEN